MLLKGTVTQVAPDFLRGALEFYSIILIIILIVIIILIIMIIINIIIFAFDRRQF